MNFTEKQKEKLLERFDYGRKVKDFVGLDANYSSHRICIYIPCPLCMEYEEDCERCKKRHNHNCKETVKEIVGGRLHFYLKRSCISWDIKDNEVVKLELEKVSQVLKRGGKI